MAKGMFESSRPRKPEGYLPGVHSEQDIPMLKRKDEAKKINTEVDTAFKKITNGADEEIELEEEDLENVA
ncbi:MAG TPA: hypothetical protein VLK22_00025 [Candidatus Udaeobacter sp.]|nr:hypothetical protein [Candidatus Udaeobacter sp.]